MKNNKIPDEFEGKWVLLNKKNKVIQFSDDVAEIVEMGRKYPIDEVVIEKKLEHGTCFF